MSDSITIAVVHATGTMTMERDSMFAAREAMRTLVMLELEKQNDANFHGVVYVEELEGRIGYRVVRCFHDHLTHVVWTVKIIV